MYRFHLVNTALLVTLAATACAAPPAASVSTPTIQVIVISPTAPPPLIEGQVVSIRASAVPTTPTSGATPTRTATVSPTSSPTRQPGDAAAQETALLAAIDALRDRENLPRYSRATELSTAARAYACDLAARGVISHTDATGRGPTERLPVATPPFTWPSESIAVGVDNADAVVALWLDEPPDGWHRRNLLDREQTWIGVGYCLRDDDPTGNRHYWVLTVTRT